ncbi:DUF4400 domain-containing protein [Hydrogenophaga sp. NFH-34]|uniref:DUF4400 domain-containing protein n=1 Tax=Hydrogenophaga sp. NFH-34 TaxID=2744446 RepID=UPI001F3C11BC|nr:DUF4400 domain-containing protein [Hydrogenophaga sp. NFH-34]
MIEIKNQFARHMILWILTGPFLAVFLMPVFMGTEKLRVPDSEYETLQELGIEHDLVTQRANTVFSSLFVETGAVQWTRKFASSKNGFGTLGERNINRGSNSYVEGFWHLIYRAIWRFMGMWPVLSVLLLAFALPAFIDGIVIRETKLDQFKPHNPVFFWLSMHSVISIAGSFLFLPLLPIAITIPVLYGAVALVSIGLWTLTANLQTGN